MHDAMPGSGSTVFGSLKLRLALAGVLLISLSVGVTGFFVLDTVAQRTERTVIDSKLSEAERLAAVLTSRVMTLREALRSAASQLPLQDLDQPQAMVRFLEQNPVLLGLFSGFHIAAPDGRLLAVADGHRIRTSDITIADRGYFQKALAERRATVSEAFVSRVSGAHPHHVAAGAHRGREGGRRAGRRAQARVERPDGRPDRDRPQSG